ncbi:MAG: flagellar biosynthesis protein FlhB [Oscillospiraceae bacterium]|jgi:flagellar biosynthetic protein FlhB|nr:flagellar biosynthesis protein FlhB [Oscillospiraceae bacterium]
MAQSSSEKTEQPTAKKRRDQRKEGNVMQSKEVVTAVSLVGTYYGFQMLYAFTSGRIESFTENCIGTLTVTHEQFVMSDMHAVFLQGLLTTLICCMPMLLIAGVLGIVPTVAQTRGLVSFKSIKPKFEKLNPIKGFQKMFSLRGVVELLKSLLKIAILGVVIYTTVNTELARIGALMDVTLGTVIIYTGTVIMNVVKNVAVYFIALALVDFLYQWWTHEKEMRMTKQEVKEEYKMTEGDPMIKSKIRQIQQQRAQARMMQQVPSADVIIRNPTHYAVALKYESGKNNSPAVIAKGADFIALKIIDIGKKHSIIIKEDKPLARALYETVDVGREIPEEFYRAVADILAYVYNIKKKKV